jgi:hypothetical protein
LHFFFFFTHHDILIDTPLNNRIVDFTCSLAITIFTLLPKNH